MGAKGSGKRTAQNSGHQRKPPRGKPFPKGVSGNPGGRPKDIGKFRELCQEKTPRALEALVSSLSDPRGCVLAAKVLLEFAWGKAPQSVLVSGNPDAPIQHEYLNLSVLTDDELRTLRKLRATAEQRSASAPH